MLEALDIDVSYGQTQVLWGVNVMIGDGEIVAMLGPNGSGKSTVLKTIIGLVRATRGRITFDGRDIGRTPVWDMAGLGIGMVLERRRLFPEMTVRENVLMGAYHRSVRDRASETYDWVESLFPILRERADQLASGMSGGEQQQVAIARGLMARPKLLLMDEPFLGLSPLMVREILSIMRRINKEGVAILFNEQNARLSFGNAHRGYLLEGGRIVLNGSGLGMLESDIVQRVYLGAA